MRRFHLRLLGILALLGCVAVPPAWGQGAVPEASLSISQGPSDRRVALVIGNGNYQGAIKLANPVNDARAMATKLKKLGFDVIDVEDGTQKAMQRAIAQFSGKLGEGAISLFYYAGHGIQVNGRNYLMPIDADITTEQTVRLEAIDVDAVIEQMSMAKSRVNLVILDACRNNPFERRFRSVSGGLASIEAPTGTLIAYATSPGKVAADGEGSQNGLYTAELLAALDQQGAKVEDVFKRVRANVVAKSAGNQTPWESSSLTGDFFFTGPTTVVVAPAVSAPAPSAGGDRELVLWTSVKDSKSPAMLQTYIDQFPQGTFAATARVMIDELKAAGGGATRSEVALIAPTGFSPSQRDGFGEFQRARGHKAMAIATSGNWGAAWERDGAFRARLGALWRCNSGSKMPCQVYAVDADVVFDEYAKIDAAAVTALEKVRGVTLARASYGEEDVDFGVAPSAELRREKHQGETPLTAPDVRTVTTRELVGLVAGKQPPVLIDVMGGVGHDTLPKAWWWRGAGDTPDDKDKAIDGLLRTLLAHVAPDKAMPLAFFCESSRCWLSYNAALRARAAGYTNVLWYRGGVVAWRAAELPTVKALQTAQLY
jgi:PQQ-dependent catabolism-associated CXXCW motif protein